MAAPRTQSTLYWLTRTSSQPAPTCCASWRGELEISHRSCDDLPTDRAVTCLRDLLAAVGVAVSANANYQSAWLFPGGHAGLPLATENFRYHLFARGLHPAEARKAAMALLAAEIPTRCCPTCSGSLRPPQPVGPLSRPAIGATTQRCAVPRTQHNE